MPFISILLLGPILTLAQETLSENAFLAANINSSNVTCSGENTCWTRCLETAEVYELDATNIMILLHPSPVNSTSTGGENQKTGNECECPLLTGTYEPETAGGMKETFASDFKVSGPVSRRDLGKMCIRCHSMPSKVQLSDANLDNI